MQIFINYKQLLSNAKTVKKQLNKNTKLCAVVKANAYGHDIVKSSLAIQDCVDYFAVAHNKTNPCVKPLLYEKTGSNLCSK